jgi:3-oxoacyl-[acyl-carrier protein] reductase
MNKEFYNKVIFITGAAGGIGSRLCECFDSLGARVYSTDIVSVNRDRFVKGDVTDIDFLHGLAENITREEGRIDVLVNNSGICPRTQLPEITVNEWQRVIDVNMTSTFFLIQFCIEVMKPQHSGAIVNVASLAGKNGGMAVGAHYSASKAAIICLTKTFAQYGAPFGVRVNAVAPGIINTGMTRELGMDKIRTFENSIPLRRIADPDEVVKPIVFLASSWASYITGATLDINGGLLMD